MRKAALQGLWYPHQPALTAMLDRNYAYSPRENLRFIVSPHAGLEYCVATQGAAFSQINPAAYLHIVILAVNHRFYLDGLAQTPFQSWENPLDLTYPLRIRHLDLPEVSRHQCQREHSAEVLIPFLAKVFSMLTEKVDFSIVYCGHSPDKAELSKLPADSNTLYVISSDFCHYGTDFDFTPQLPGKTIEQTIDHMNLEAVDGILKSSALFADKADQYGNTICGRYTIETGLRVAERLGKYQAKMLFYAKSGSVSTKDESSVSYIAIAGWAESNSEL